MRQVLIKLLFRLPQVNCLRQDLSAGPCNFTCTLHMVKILVRYWLRISSMCCNLIFNFYDGFEEVRLGKARLLFEIIIDYYLA